MKSSWNFRQFREFHFSKVQKRVPTFARLRMTVSNASGSVATRPLFAKVRKVRNSHSLTFGSKMNGEVTFSIFGAPKATFRAQARQCACSQWFLDGVYGPGELKCNFFAQKSLSALFNPYAQKPLFAKK